MIESRHLSNYIEQNLPELSGSHDLSKCDNAFDIAQAMIQYTAESLACQNMKAVQDCLNLAERLHTDGNAEIKNAIENEFIFSFSSSFFHDEEKSQKVMNIMPARLYELYKKQVLYSHL